MSGPAEPVDAARPPFHLAGDRIHIAGRTLSAAQYRWLFPDLAQNLPDGDAAALRHFEATGQHELADGRRTAPEARLLELQLQRFSPAAPDEEKSPNFAFRPGSTGILDVYFSYPVPGEQFVPSVQDTAGGNARLHVKETTHSYFQRGVPGISTSIEETAQWLERIVAWMQPSRLRIFGLSAGGYAALVFGHLLSADAVLAISPEVVLGKPLYRSERWFPNAIYNPDFQDVTPIIEGLGARLALVYPAYDPLDYEMIRLCRERRPASMAFVPHFHPGLACIDVGAFVRAGAGLPALADVLVQQYDFRDDDAAIASAVRAYESIMNRDYATSLPQLRDLFAADPNNFGFLMHVGAQQALLGDPAQGVATMRDALAGIRATHRNTEIGRIVARASRAPLRYYYDADRRMIALLERLWDEAAGEPG